MNAFSDCSRLEKIAYPDNLENPLTNGIAVAYPSDNVIIEDGIVWNSSKTVLYFATCDYVGQLSLPNSVTSIGDYALYKCTELTSIVLPHSLTSIGDYAFYGCSGLTSIDIPIAVTEIGESVFQDCTSLKDATLPNALESIGKNAFAYCSSLESIIIPEQVSTIGDGAFQYCVKMKWIESQSVTPPTVQSNTFQGGTEFAILVAASEDYKTAPYWMDFNTMACGYIPSGTTFEANGFKYEIISINDLTCRLYAVDAAKVGENVIIPETVEYKNREFAPIEIRGIIIKNSVLNSVLIPNCTSTISDGAIFNSNIGTLTIDAPISSNFIYYSSIDELVVSSSVKKFFADLYKNNVYKLTIEDSNETLVTTGFNSKSTKEIYLGRDCSGASFYGMTSLESVTISNNVTNIDGMFQQCSALKSINIPNSVTSVGIRAFEGCSSLTSIIIPASVMTVGDYAFRDCSDCA
jgi:hypothetical protein